MKILITGRGYSSRDREQLGIFEQDQARALAAAGHDVRYAAVDTRSVRSRRPLGARQFVLDGMPVYYAAVPLGNMTSNSNWFAQRRCAEMIWRLMKKSGWQPDIIHSHFGGSFCDLAKENGVPFVYTEHNSGSNSADIPDWELARERELYPRVDALLCVSARQAETLRRNTGVTPTVVHNIVDVDAFAYAPRRREAEGGFRFAAAGNLIQRKGYDLLLRALAEVRGRDLDCSLTVIGDGEEAEPLRELTRSLGLEENVRFLGRLTRAAMAEEYRDADAFTLASRLETFGVVYIEAMAAGLPVIATACGGPEDFVSHDNGILVPAEDAAALADAMERMIRTRDSYDGVAIARFARDSFSPGTIAGKLETIYTELLGQE